MKLTASIEIEAPADARAGDFNAKVRAAVEDAIAELMERGEVSEASPCKLTGRGKGGRR